MTPSEKMYPLLALCARTPGQPTQYQHLRRQAADLTDWNKLSTQAEAHGLTPLLYTHLQAANVPLPIAIKEQWQARTMQHGHANHVRGHVLAEILTAFQAAEIDVLILKGAALAHLIYPNPSLRPMRDIDLLVSQAQARPAQALLAELGFEAPLPGQALPAKHLPAAVRRVNGIPVTVELHHNLYSSGTPATELEALRLSALPLMIESVTAQTLGYEAMLDHIYQHLRINLLLDSLRLIWMADLVSLAERFAAEINWRRVNPRIRNVLGVCHWLTPLSEELLRTAHLNPGRPPNGIGQEFQGWPRYALAAQQHKGYGGILRDSFFPSEWWLRFYYGLPSGWAVWWGRAVSHPLHIWGWVGHYFKNRATAIDHEP